MQQRSVLLIYTGGTIGMVNDPKTGLLEPFDFEQITHQVPELEKFPFQIDSFAFENPLDSSNMHPKIWVDLAKIIHDNYEQYDGFVILHGSDTMAYTASALSFSLENLSKPVILTGSQLPIGTIRTDGKENLITAIEIAGSYENNIPLVPEVAIYFEYQLYRGNRSTKVNAEHFEAFVSYNYPKLAEAGVHIKYNRWAIRPYVNQPLVLNTAFDQHVGVLPLFPGITQENLSHFFDTPGIRCAILQTYGAGNAPSALWFEEAINYGIQKGISIFNITQCLAGSVDQGKYGTSNIFRKAGVVSGKDMTIEAAVTKLMFLAGKHTDSEVIKAKFSVPACGELTI